MQAEGCHFVVGIEHQRASVGIDNIRGLLPGSHQPTRQRARIAFVFQHDVHGADDVLDVDGLVVGIVVVIVVGVGSPEAEGGVVVVVLQHVVQRALHVVHVHPSAQVGIAHGEVHGGGPHRVFGHGACGGHDEHVGILCVGQQPSVGLEGIAAAGVAPGQGAAVVAGAVHDAELRVAVERLRAVVVAHESGQVLDAHVAAQAEHDGRHLLQSGPLAVAAGRAVLVAQAQRGDGGGQRC